MNQIEPQIMDKARVWLGSNFDEGTRREVKSLMDNNPKELTECFYRTLEFGTGGLRGIMGVGTNRMNKYTVGMATQGLANYLKKQFPDDNDIKVTIAYDCRNNSRFFAEITAGVFAANGIKAYLFESLRPTPELSFAIRHFNCKSGIVITASHNPKEYNGYKAYWEGGGQVVPPHDKNIINEVNHINSIDEVKFSGNAENIRMIGEDVDELYLNKLKNLSLSPEAIAKHKDMKIVYTPLHGTGIKLVPQFLGKLGFTNIVHVPEQDVNDGNFPTVASPNPEEASALKMAIDKAVAENADLVMATDPDADRIGIAVRDNNNRFVLLNGNQTASIITYYLLRKWKENGKLTGNEYIVKTIVTTDLLTVIAEHYGVQHYNVLTGFKYIADVIHKNEGKKTFICGGEESYGFLIGEYVRDKDAVMTGGMIAEAAAWAKEQGKTLYQLLLDIYVEFGFFKEGLLSLTKKGKEGVEEIQRMMENFRQSPLQSIDGSQVVLVKDFMEQECFDMISDLHYTMHLPKSDVLQFVTVDNTILSIRPSGTEPKIKFYFGVREELKDIAGYENANTAASEKINRIIEELKLK
ncbi:MAG: phospho-sugar mutase [Prevotellaceae bacterium]|jgi:phosphoglucomutase|nr:phospho-sugar mutase [Prevotellaceae bacterium]